MLKKILAGSTAGILALTAMASQAMAADAQIVIENLTWWENVTIELTTKITNPNIVDFLGGDAGAVASRTDDTLNSYSNMIFSIWKKDGVSATLDSGKITTDIKGYVQEYETIPQGKEYFDADGNPTVVDAPGGANIEIGVKGHAAYSKYSSAGGGTWTYDATNKPKGATEKTIAKTESLKADSKWNIASTNPANGFVTVPASIKGAFGLTNNSQLIDNGIDYDKSSVTLDFTVTLPNSQFKDMIKNMTSTDTWDWDDAKWTASYIESLLTSQEGKQTVNQYFGVAAESGTMLDGKYTRVGGLSQKGVEVEVKKVNDPVSGSNKNALPKKAAVPVGVGQNANLSILKEMNKGGTVTFEFNKDVSHLVTASVLFYSTSGQLALPLNADFAWSESGKTMSCKFPAGLTYSEQLNRYNSFKMEYEINDKVIDGVYVDTNPNTAFGDEKTWDGNLVKITFTADGSGSSDKPNGGLVEDDKNKPSNSDSTPSTPSNSGNSGSSGNDNKNPSTGVAVAVAPVALAAAAAAVVISKKRK